MFKLLLVHCDQYSFPDGIEMFLFWLLNLICRTNKVGLRLLYEAARRTSLAEVFNDQLQMTASLYSLIYRSQLSIYTNPCDLLETIGLAQ